MEWTWRTATELNMPNSPKLLNSVQEMFCEVSEPNPMGNAVMSEETHGNAVVGVAAASAVAQPPVDTVSLASSCTNKCHHTRHSTPNTSSSSKLFYLLCYPHSNIPSFRCLSMMQLDFILSFMLPSNSSCFVS